MITLVCSSDYFTTCYLKMCKVFGLILCNEVVHNKGMMHAKENFRKLQYGRMDAILWYFNDTF